jgi:hypothetical protein
LHFCLQLFAYDFVKAYLSPKDGTPGKLAFLPVSPIAGSCAGISSTLCMYPLELLKTRLTIQVGIFQFLVFPTCWFENLPKVEHQGFSDA